MKNNFFKIYEDLWNTDKLNRNERDVYITLRTFLQYGTDTGIVYPSIETLSKKSKVGLATTKKCIKALISKGFIKKEDSSKFQNNRYYITDLKVVLADEPQEPKPQEPKQTVKDKLEEWKQKKQNHKQTEQTQDKQEPKATLQINKKDDSISMEQLKERYCFDDVVKATNKEDAEAFLSIIHDTVNSTRDTVRIASSNMLKNTVLGQMLDITKEELIYTIQLFKAQTQEIKNPKYYILTMLYNAKRQYQVYMLNKSRQEAQDKQTQAQAQEPSTTSTAAYTSVGRYKTISADATNTTLPTCDKKIDTKNRFNNFEQRTYDYDAIFRMQQQQYV